MSVCTGMDIPGNVSLPLLAIGVFTLLLSLIFCCYMWRLKRQAKQERGYKKIIFTLRKRQKFKIDTCPVCLEEFINKEKVAVCPCQHMFHLRCLLEWLRHKNCCPMCKAAVRVIPNESTGLVPSNVPQTSRTEDSNV